MKNEISISIHGWEEKIITLPKACSSCQSQNIRTYVYATCWGELRLEVGMECLDCGELTGIFESP